MVVVGIVAVAVVVGIVVVVVVVTVVVTVVVVVVDFVSIYRLGLFVAIVVVARFA